MVGFRKKGSQRLHFREPCEDAFEEKILEEDKEGTLGTTIDSNLNKG